MIFFVSIKECVKDEYRDNILKHKMLFWSINDDQIYPYGCNLKNKYLEFDNWKKVQPSKK